jgi:hypothetical protein
MLLAMWGNVGSALQEVVKFSQNENIIAVDMWKAGRLWS